MITGFKVAVRNMFKELKTTMLKEVKEGMITMFFFFQIENSDKEIKIIKRT